MSLWQHRSYTFKSNTIDSVYRKNIPIRFINPATQNGSRPTISTELAEAYSLDKEDWVDIPEGIKVTGKIKGSYALILKELMGTVQDYAEIKHIDLRYYSFLSGDPLKFNLGASTILCKNLPAEHSECSIKSYKRQIYAEGLLQYPYCVYLK